MRERSELARKGIARGRSVVALAYSGGVLFVAENPSRSLQKVSELYDRVGFAAVGRFNEFDNLRRGGIQFAASQLPRQHQRRQQCQNEQEHPAAEAGVSVQVRLAVAERGIAGRVGREAAPKVEHQRPLILRPQPRLVLPQLVQRTARDVLEPEDDIIGIGSGGGYALAAARALIDVEGLDAETVARRAMAIAAGICVYTNDKITLEKLTI